MARLRLISARTADDVVLDVLRHLPPVLPDEVAGGGVDGLDDVPRVRHVEDAAVGDRRRLLAAGVEPARPDQAQVGHVVPVDPVEGAVAPTVEGPPPHEPVPGRGALEHGVGDGDEVLALRRLRLRGDRPRGRQQDNDRGQRSERRAATPMWHGPLLESPGLQATAGRESEPTVPGLAHVGADPVVQVVALPADGRAAGRDRAPRARPAARP